MKPEPRTCQRMIGYELGEIMFQSFVDCLINSLKPGKASKVWSSYGFFLRLLQTYRALCLYVRAKISKTQTDFCFLSLEGVFVILEPLGA